MGRSGASPRPAAPRSRSAAHPRRPGFRLRPPPSRELPPDLDQRTPSGLALQSSNGRELLGFTSASDNVGLGPVSIVASRPSRTVPNMRAAQRIRVSPHGARTYPGIGLLHFTVAFPHMHWHLLDFQRYELRRASDHALVVRDRKSGFCLADHWAQVRGAVSRQTARAGLHVELRAARAWRARDLGGNIGGLYRSLPGVVPWAEPRHHARPGGHLRARPPLESGAEVRELRYENDAASVRVRLTRTSGAPHVQVLARCPDSEWCPD